MEDHKEDFQPCAHCMAAFEKLKAALEETQHSSKTDVLTGLPNLLAFQERFALELAQVRRHAWPLVVCMADLDDFKGINDTHGHVVGDKILIQFGRLLKEAFQRETDFVARRSGDEFLVILPSTSHSQAKKLVARFEELVKKELFMVLEGGARASTIASVGFEELREGEDPTDFLKRVDGDLYRVKRGEKKDDLFGE